MVCCFHRSSGAAVVAEVAVEDDVEVTVVVDVGAVVVAGTALVVDSDGVSEVELGDAAVMTDKGRLLTLAPAAPTAR